MFRIFLVFMSIVVCLIANTAVAQDMCAQAAGQGDNAIREQYQNTIDYFLKLAAGAQAKGFDPRNFPQINENGDIESIDLIKIAQDLSSRRDEGISAVYSAYQECEQQIAPYQKALDITMTFLGPGLREVIPERASHIDAGMLLAGLPFGGPNALVPQTREYILARLGIGGDAANFIRNPLQPSSGGLVRLPWIPMLAPGIPGVPSINIPAVGSLPQLPPLPTIKPPPPATLGTIGGHRVCVPWC